MLTQIYKDSIFRVISIILNFGTNILITRLLTIEDRSAFGLIMNDATLIAQIFNFGLHTSALIILTKNHQQAREYSNISFVLIGLAVISYLIWTQLFSSFSTITVFITSTFIFNLCLIFFSSGYTAIGKIRLFNILEIMKSIVICVLLVALHKIISSLSAIYLIYISINLVFYIYIIFCFQKISYKKNYKSFKFWTQNYKISIRSYISCGFASVFSWYAIYLAKIQQEQAIISNKTLGQFILSFNHIAYAVVLFSSIALIFTPQLISQENKKKMLESTLILICVNILVLSIGTAIIYPWMEDIFSFIYGEKYKISGWYFKKMLPICYFIVFLSSISPFITALKMPLISIISPALSLISFMLLTHFFMNTNGVIEIIDAYFYSIFIWCVLYAGFLIKIFMKNYFSNSSKPI